MLRRIADEPPGVRIQLVAALFTAALPLGMMIVTFSLVGCYVVFAQADKPAALATGSGLLAGLWKASLHCLFRRGVRRAPVDEVGAAAWERRFGVANYAFAFCIGMLAARTFMLQDPGGQLLAIGMLFGFCSGQVARVAVRPRICSVSILLAVSPAAVASATHGGVPHVGLAAMFVLFSVGGLESVRYAYGQIRQRIAANLELVTIAQVDPLTGLRNRLGLRRFIDDQVGRCGSRTMMVAVHCFDLDGFKPVNDRLGHSAGDALLVELSRRVGSMLHDSDVAVRLGGDEFLVVQCDIDHVEKAEIFGRRLFRTVTAPYSLEDRSVTIGMSLGTCTGQLPNELLEDLIGVADGRMYDVKRTGGGGAAAARSGIDCS
ncbi:GGDEF domain-containing protein [Sphingomonas melonis]|uniref:Diguanylate cyclase (GGDEF)-like protein n=1 Tax=Sphingomonas melonis TaxID=152682 RepID=A0A7Y9K0P5_9SPHN|nr:GGDEF domain-containing protein [Sphingomonas melonis]NYD89121.1 diguanylate cyclase (GGDEF)-like protein [Sphingomonas melonis]